MHNKLRIGIIGLGNISAVHIKTFQNEAAVQIASLADVNRTLLENHSGIVGTRLCFDYHDVLNDPSIDIVDILLPHYLHAKVIEEALCAGKEVICEKPFVTNARDADKIIHIAKKTKKRVYLKQYLRFVGLHKKIKELLDGGAIGIAYLTHCVFTTDTVSEYSDPNSWRGNMHEAGGGVFMDVGVHMVDLLQWFFGNPISVCATVKKNFSSLPQKGEDLAVVTIEFPHNIVANIVCTSADSSYGFRWEKHFFGSEGSLHLEDDKKQLMSLTLRKERAEVTHISERDWWNLANRSALLDIIERVRVNKNPLVSLEDAGIAIRTICSAYDSARIGKKIQLR